MRTSFLSLVLSFVFIFSVQAFAAKSKDIKAPPVDTPQILSDNDEGLYQEIFASQEKGKIKEANAKIEELESNILLGHVLAQRYLHPSYKTQYQELKNWLSEYADHPEAEDIYSMAKKRGPRAGLTLPKKPSSSVGGSYGWLEGSSDKNTSAAQNKTAKKFLQNFKHKIWKGWTKNAKNVLEDAIARKAVNEKDLNEMKGYLAFSYFLDNMSDFSKTWGEAAAKAGSPMANWTMGLVLWREGAYEQSREYFKRLALSKDATEDMIAAAAYWAARKDVNFQTPDESDTFLKVAANYPRTFYGILARRALGQNIEYNWETNNLYQDSASELISWQSGIRALALLQIGDVKRSQDELVLLLRSAENEELKDAILALADQNGMASLSITLASESKKKNGDYNDTSYYPVAGWQPENGWQIDRALVYAFIRQESRFKPTAKSHAGARGLMQIMPHTASFISGDKTLLNRKDRLLAPEYNLALGQDYIEHLLNDEVVDGDLFKLLAAYNAGPGNLNKWLKKVDYQDDPLLFIESIPSKETRIYIEKVLANFWIYCNRFGQPVPSLDAVVANRWPHYESFDSQLAQAE